MPKIDDVETARVQKRQRVELAAAAAANVQAATAQLEAALGNMLSTGIGHPVIADLRETILNGRKILARVHEVQRRLPL